MQNLRTKKPATKRLSAQTVGNSGSCPRRFFASERRSKAIKLACVLLALVLIVAGVQVLLSYVARDFMTAISKKDAAAYWRLLGGISVCSSSLSRSVLTTGGRKSGWACCGGNGWRST